MARISAGTPGRTYAGLDDRSRGDPRLVGERTTPRREMRRPLVEILAAVAV